MASLLFGTTYLIHKGIVKHYRDKQRQRNYERWEDLRDEYDEMKQPGALSSQRNSLDFADEQQQDQDSSQWNRRASGQYDERGRGILTLRDQQEANIARVSWRPQEIWDPASRAADLRDDDDSRDRAAARGHKMGSMWDEDLPEPLRVSRRSWDGNGNPRPGSATGKAAHRSTSVPRSASAERERENRDERKDDVVVVESPFDWWKR